MIFVTKRGEVADCLPSLSCQLLPSLPSLLILTQGLLPLKKVANLSDEIAVTLMTSMTLMTLVVLMTLHILLIKSDN